jgi:cyclophilin family peptidyl-prolyl cis-trans isomerase
MEFHRAWSPQGYDRAVELFERGFYDHSHFFRVVPNFLVQFGITYSTSEELKRFARTTIPDDPQLDPPVAFQEGTISYAGSGDNSRNSQLFIAYAAHKAFGTNKWETPVGRVVEGYDNVKKFYSYGDMPPWGEGPVQGKIFSGRSYIEDNFPLTDKFSTCTVERKGGDVVTKEEQVDAERKLPDAGEEEEEEEDWSASAHRRDAPKDADYLDKPGNVGERFKDTIQTLRSRVKETDSSFDLIAMSAILIVIILLFLLRLGLKPKSHNKNS